MTHRPLILVTNDDGVNAPGIRHLLQSLEKNVDVIAVAPTTEQSAVGLSITMRQPLRIEQIKWPLSQATVWTVNGTPADCVKLALKVILPRTPDMIVSGINRGSNAGRNILYSGTVAAVIEGIMHDVPGIAFSMADYFNPIYEGVEPHISAIIQYLLSHPLPLGSFLNVNFPSQHIQKGIKGFRFAKQGKEYWAENPEQREHPAEGHAYYWLGSKLAEYQEESDSDIALLKEGYATAVPIQVWDLTHHTHLNQHRDHFEAFVNSKNLKETAFDMHPNDEELAPDTSQLSDVLPVGGKGD
jgi:5'-nucleotidase